MPETPTPPPAPGPKGKKIGRPFVKGDPRTKNGGRPKKSVEWKEAEDALREAIPRLLLLPQNDLKNLLQSNPTGAEILAAKFLTESPAKAVERFLGKMPLPLTGAEGKPLIPEGVIPQLPPINFAGWTEKQIDDFIQATSARASEQKPAA